MDKWACMKIISKRNARSAKSLFNKHLYQYASLVLTVYAIGMFCQKIYINIQQSETNKVVKEYHQFTGSQSNSSNG